MAPIEIPSGKATIVCLYPFGIREQKPGLIPPVYEIPPVKYGDFAILPITDGCFYVYLDQFRGSMKVTTPALVLAKSICDDFINAFQHGTSPDACPALFFVPGHPSKDEIRKNFARELAEATERQLRWYRNLVKIADDAWQKSHLHTAITDIEREASKVLGYNREWSALPDPTEIKTCPNCNNRVPKSMIVCHCRYIFDMEAYKKMNFAPER